MRTIVLFIQNLFKAPQEALSVQEIKMTQCILESTTHVQGDVLKYGPSTPMRALIQYEAMNPEVYNSKLKRGEVDTLDYIKIGNDKRSITFSFSLFYGVSDHQIERNKLQCTSLGTFKYCIIPK